MSDAGARSIAVNSGQYRLTVIMPYHNAKPDREPMLAQFWTTVLYIRLPLYQHWLIVQRLQSATYRCGRVVNENEYYVNDPVFEVHTNGCESMLE